jgi:hypothetical protein
MSQINHENKAFYDQTNEVFQKRVLDLVLDLAEAEARTHNQRFEHKRISRKFINFIKSIVRSNKFLLKLAIGIRNKR